jgi:hypothetical protein
MMVVSYPAARQSKFLVRHKNRLGVQVAAEKANARACNKLKGMMHAATVLLRPPGCSEL